MAASVINKIRYEGNEITQASTFDREIYIKNGDVIDYKTIVKSRQTIMDLGLFKKLRTI